MSTETTQAFDDFLFHLPQITQNFIKQLHDEGHFTALRAVILKKKTGTLKTIIMSNMPDRKPNP